jgi:hypothetical protein
VSELAHVGAQEPDLPGEEVVLGARARSAVPPTAA